jgi:hypothetical protein
MSSRKYTAESLDNLSASLSKITNGRLVHEKENIRQTLLFYSHLIKTQKITYDEETNKKLDTLVKRSFSLFKDAGRL